MTSAPHICAQVHIQNIIKTYLQCRLRHGPFWAIVYSHPLKMSSPYCLWPSSTLASQEYILHNGFCGYCHLLRVCSTRRSVWTLSTSPPQEWTLHSTLPGFCPLSFLRVFSALVPLLITHSHSWECFTVPWGKRHLFFYSILCVSWRSSLNGHQRTRKLKEGQDKTLVAT